MFRPTARAEWRRSGWVGPERGLCLGGCKTMPYCETIKKDKASDQSSGALPLESAPQRSRRERGSRRALTLYYLVTAPFNAQKHLHSKACGDQAVGVLRHLWQSAAEQRGRTAQFCQPSSVHHNGLFNVLQPVGQCRICKELKKAIITKPQEVGPSTPCSAQQLPAGSTHSLFPQPPKPRHASYAPLGERDMSRGWLPDLRVQTTEPGVRTGTRG